MQNVFKFVSIESEIVNDVSLTNEDEYIITYAYKEKKEKKKQDL